MKKRKSFRLPDTLLKRIRARVRRGSAMSSVAVFEEAIESLTAQGELLDVELSCRGGGKRLGGKPPRKVKVNTKLSERHLLLLADFAKHRQRSETAVLQVALEAMLRRGSAAQAARERSRQFFLPPLSVKAIPPWGMGLRAPWLHRIPDGVFVLIDAWSLFAGMVTTGPEGSPGSISKECQDLLDRCADGKLVGIISPLALQRLQFLMAEADSYGGQYNERIPGKQMEELGRRLSHLPQTRFKLLPLDSALFQQATLCAPFGSVLTAWELLCASSFVGGPFVVATASQSYDFLMKQEEWLRIPFSIHKVHDVRFKVSAANVPMDLL